MSNHKPSLAGIDRVDPSLKDSDYSAHSWQELKQLIGDNNLGQLRRWPSERRKYMHWSAETREKYGSVIDFIVQVRLKWKSLPDMNSETGSLFELDDPVPFRSSKDWKILLNDWPYGFETGIVHMIVWMKHRLGTEPVLGDLTPAARMQVQDFIEKTFQRDIDNFPGTSDRIVWFKNWTALQTVPGIDHIHVLVRDIPQSMLQKWLNT